MAASDNGYRLERERNTTRTDIAAHQPEFYLHALRVICIGNALALLAVIAIAIYFASSTQMVWTSVGPFNQLFEFITLEFFVFNCVLFLMLRYRSWYQKTPRLGLNKLRYLTWVVLAWDGVHFLIGFEVFGGFHGPFVILLPLLCVLAFLALPGRAALIACASLGVALLALAVAQSSDHFFPLGALGINFTRVPESTGVVAAVALAGTAASVYLGWRLQNWLGTTQLGTGALSFIDPRFDCFTAATLERRTQEERHRVTESASTSAFLLIGVEDLAETVQAEGIDAGWEALQRAQEVIAANTRSDLDTCAYLGQGRFGILLPTAGYAQAENIAGRILEATAHSPGPRPLHLGYGITEITGGEVPASDPLGPLSETAQRDYRIPS